MKTNTRQFSSTLIIIAFVLALSGIFAGYAYAQKGVTECPTRWGEPIGVGCSMPSEITTVATKALPTTVGEEGLAECPTRWGEPIGIGCR